MPLNTSLTFSQNVTSLSVTLEVVADSVVEEDEVLLAELVVPEGESGVSLRSSRVAITIINDDSNSNIHTCDCVMYVYTWDRIVVNKEVYNYSYTRLALIRIPSRL